MLNLTNLMGLSIYKIVEYGLYGLAAFVVLLTILIVSIKASKAKKRKAELKKREVDDVVVKGGVRYSEDATIVDENGEQNISYVKHDIILQPRKMVQVSTKGELKPGKWTVLSAYGNEDTFNIRIGLYVKEYKHGQEIILAEGDEICPTSTTIILR